MSQWLKKLVEAAWFWLLFLPRIVGSRRQRKNGRPPERGFICRGFDRRRFGRAILLPGCGGDLLGFEFWLGRRERRRFGLFYHDRWRRRR